MHLKSFLYVRNNLAYCLSRASEEYSVPHFKPNAF